MPRFRQALERFGDRLLERVFTAEEIAYAGRSRRGSAQRLAARYAAKCAARRLIVQVGAPAPGLREIEVARRRSGEPVLRVHGAAQEALQMLSVGLSLSHDADFAVASLWAERVASGHSC